MVYIDDFYKYGKLQGVKNYKMSHMIADSKEELVKMAELICIKLKHIQFEGTYKEHFDVCYSKRKLVIKNGAKEITYRQLGEIVLNRKK